MDAKGVYVSVVVNARNDDHGGRMIDRLQATIRWNMRLLEAYKVPSEIVLVDYNPPKDKPLLSDVLEMPQESEYCSVREIVVPPEIHDKYPDSEHINIYVLLAQNIGIRRARGEVVISIMADILLSVESVEILASKEIKENSYYRADRIDINRGVLDVDYAEIPDYIENNILQIQTRYGRMPFVGLKKKQWRKLLFNINTKHANSRLHTNASGDFIMMSKSNWHKLRGFAEIDVLGRYVDGLMCHMAFFSGLEEKMVGSVFHIDHDSKWKSSPLSIFEKGLFLVFPKVSVLRVMNFVSRLIARFNPDVLAVLGGEREYEKIGVKPLGRKEYMLIVDSLKNGRRDVSINGRGWGLYEHELREVCMTKSGASQER